MSLADEILKNDKLTSGTYEISCSDLYLTAVMSGNTGTAALKEESGANNQKFILSQNNDGTWRLTSASDEGHCLDVRGCNGADGTPLIIYPRNDTPAQKFKIVRDGGGYRIFTGASNYKKFVAAKDGKKAEQSSVNDDRSLWLFGK